MTRLPVVAALRPTVVVVCTLLHATLSAAACAARHAALWPSGRRKGSPRFHPCAGCGLGEAVLARLEAGGWQRPADSMPAEVLEPAQRRARQRWARSFPAWAVPQGDDLDPLAVAALMAPDDRGEPADLG